MRGEFRSVHFKVHINVMRLAKLGCGHELTHGVRNWQPGCRACSVGQALEDSELEIAWHEDYDSRVFIGHAETIEQRNALTRLIALCQGHADPMELVDVRR